MFNQSGQPIANRQRQTPDAKALEGTCSQGCLAETQATSDGAKAHSAVTVKRFMKIVKKAAVEMEKEYEHDPDGFEADADPFWPEVDKAMDLWRDEQL